MIHHFDHRWASYTPEGESGERDEADKRDPTFRVLPRYWVDAREVDSRLVDKHWVRGWLMGWRDITSMSNERTVIASAIPRVAVSNKLPLLLPAHELSQVS